MSNSPTMHDVFARLTESYRTAQRFEVRANVELSRARTADSRARKMRALDAAMTAFAKVEAADGNFEELADRYAGVRSFFNGDFAAAVEANPQSLGLQLHYVVAFLDEADAIFSSWPRTAG